MYQSGEADKKGNSTFELEICREQCPRLHRFESRGTTSLATGKVPRHRRAGERGRGGNLGDKERKYGLSPVYIGDLEGD